MAYYQSALRYHRPVIILLLLLAPLSFLFAMAVGSVSISWPQLWAILSGHENDVTYNLEWNCDCRVPSTPLQPVACWHSPVH